MPLYQLWPIYSPASYVARGSQPNFDMDQLCAWDFMRLILSSNVYVHWPFIFPIENPTEILVAVISFLFESGGK